MKEIAWGSGLQPWKALPDLNYRKTSSVTRQGDGRESLGQADGAQGVLILPE